MRRRVPTTTALKLSRMIIVTINIFKLTLGVRKYEHD
jgi:hypothetical protein